MNTLLGFGMPSGWEWIVILLIGLILFGRRLPEVGRSLGRGIIEFRKGVKGIEDDIEDASSPSEPQPAERKELPKDVGSADDRVISQSAPAPPATPDTSGNPGAAGGSASSPAT